MRCHVGIFPFAQNTKLLSVILYCVADKKHGVGCRKQCKEAGHTTGLFALFSTSHAMFYIENFAASSRALGSTRTEPSGKMIVGTLLMPPFTLITKLAALSSSSMLI